MPRRKEMLCWNDIKCSTRDWSFAFTLASVMIMKFVSCLLSMRRPEVKVGHPEGLEAFITSVVWMCVRSGSRSSQMCSLMFPSNKSSVLTLCPGWSPLLSSWPVVGKSQTHISATQDRQDPKKLRGHQNSHLYHWHSHSTLCALSPSLSLDGVAFYGFCFSFGAKCF